jgi:hypothetical protein
MKGIPALPLIVFAVAVRLASFFGPLRQFNLAHPKSLILLARLFSASLIYR